MKDKEQIPYGEFTLDNLKEIIEGLFKRKPKLKSDVYYINEGNGYIPFEQSESLNKAIKEYIKKDKLL